MVRIWFNHWFSTAYRFIEGLKEKDENYVIVSNERDTSAQQAVADEFYVEPVFSNGADYLDWCLTFCKEHNVDVFFPRRGAALMASNIEKFEELGVKVIVERDRNIHKLFDSKYESCLYVGENNLCAVPKMFLVNTREEFLRACAAIIEQYGNKHCICIKRDTDEGGITFKRVYGAKDKLYYNEVLIKDAEKIIAESEAPYVVMPYLEEPEISIDCLRTPEGFIAVPRIKETSRVTRICFDAELLEIAHKINDNLKIEYPYNIQLRQLNGKYMFMEINLRLSGGSFKDRAVGCNFPQLALDVATGNRIDYQGIIEAQKEVRVVSVEDYAII